LASQPNFATVEPPPHVPADHIFDFDYFHPTGLAEGEHEVVGRELVLRGQHLGLVLDAWEAQTQAHPSSLVITAWQ